MVDGNACPRGWLLLTASVTCAGIARYNVGDAEVGGYGSGR